VSILAVARALANKPRLLLADEPTGNLDEKIGQEIIEILVKLNADQKMTMVLVTHNPLVADRTRRQFRLGSGKLIEETVKP
jgi:putative ABC transport system ATP-binding protein